jgi:hypothetical protein
MSPSTTERFTVLAAALISGSCRFGGPSGDPTLPVHGAAGTGGQAGQAGTGQAGDAGSGLAGRGGTSGAFGGEGGNNPGGAAGSAVDAGHDAADDTPQEGGVERDTSSIDGNAGTDGNAGADRDADDDDDSDGDSADNAPPTACLPPFSSAVCDPVCNIGCPALFRCDITDAPRTGVCLGTLLSPATEGMACTRTPLTDDCIERLSCIEGICRRLCYRDTDCTTSGTCCNTAIDMDGGPSGYRSCAPCRP